MPRKRYPTEPPPGWDEPRLAAEVRQDTWIIDPDTGEWAYVKQVALPRRGCTGFGAGRTHAMYFSLKRLGERFYYPEEPLTVRVPAAQEHPTR